MNKLVVLLLALSLICFTAAGCGAKDKLEEKAAEKMVEEMLEKGGAEDVDIDGDKVTITGEDGEEVTFGGGEWPDSDLAKSIPELNEGKIASIMETSNYLMISFEEVEEADATAYIEESKPEFILDNYESKSEDMITWSGKNDKDIQLSLTYVDESFTIMLLMEESE